MKKFKYCPNCGVKIEKRKYLDNCNEEIISDAKFCVNCGKKLL